MGLLVLGASTGLVLGIRLSCSIIVRNYYDEILTRRVCLGGGTAGARGQQCLCEGARHKVSPKSTDPVHLYILYR